MAQRGKLERVFAAEDTVRSSTVCVSRGSATNNGSCCSYFWLVGTSGRGRDGGLKQQQKQPCVESVGSVQCVYEEGGGGLLPTTQEKESGARRVCGQRRKNRSAVSFFIPDCNFHIFFNYHQS